MASKWFEALGPWGKSLVIVGGGVALSGVAYGSYRYWQSKNVVNKDEGFEDVPKLTEENLEKRILVLGLDGAGKSSLLARLGKQENKFTPKPTEGFNVMCVNTDSTALNIWEIGGAKPVRQYWSNFVQDTELLLYVVDASDEPRLPEAYDELHKLLGDERLKKVPIIVVANKQDKSGALNPQEVQSALGLDNVNPKDHKVHALGTQVPREGEKLGVEELEKLMAKWVS